MSPAPIKRAYLIGGLYACGKTTLGQTLAHQASGVCLTFDDFFYKVVNPDEPKVFNLDTRRSTSACRWYWMQLKTACDRGTTPLYLDHIHLGGLHTKQVAHLLVRNYGYHLDTVEPPHPRWAAVRGELIKPPESREYGPLYKLAHEMTNASPHAPDIKAVVQTMAQWVPFTIADLMD